MFLGEMHGMKFQSHDSDDSDYSDDFHDSHNSEKGYPSVHFLFDEVPQEIFTSSYSTELAQGLEKYFEHSTVVIALQSVKKVREIKSVDEPNKPQPQQMDIEPLTNSGVEIFKLKTCVRMSSQLHELQKNLEAKAEQTPFQSNLTYKKIIGQLI